MRDPYEIFELQRLFALQHAQAQSAYAQHILNAQMSAAAQQYGPSPPPSEVAVDARQGLLIEGTARRVDAS